MVLGLVEVTLVQEVTNNFFGDLARLGGLY